MRLFLRTHGLRNAALGIPCARLLHDVSAVFEDFFLPLNLVGKRVLDRLEGVDVLHFRLRSQRLLPCGTERDVEVGAQISFLHVAVGNVDVFEDRLDFFHVGAGFFGRRHIRLGNDLDERNARAVVIDVRRQRIRDRRARVNKLACILFHMDAQDADAFRAIFRLDVDVAMLGNRQVILRCLEVLRQVWIVVVLAVKLAVLVDRAVERQTRLDGELDDALVEHGQDAGKPQAHGADLRVLLGAELRGAAAENLRVRLELAVDLKTDDCFIIHPCAPPIFAMSLWKECACS